MGLFKDYVSQTRKPEGRLGAMMISGMNSGHAQMADWGIAHLKGVHAEKILEIGCGGGSWNLPIKWQKKTAAPAFSIPTPAANATDICIWEWNWRTQGSRRDLRSMI